MANRFAIRRSSTPGNIPTTVSLNTGELGLNMADQILYASDGSTVFELGANVATQVIRANLLIGNSTVNTFANSTLVKIANSTAIANLTSSTLVIGGSTVNTTAYVAGANVFLSTTTLSVGNTTANLLANSILVKVANSTGTANLQPTQLVIGTSTVNTTTFVAGANIFLNTTTLSIGNTTANLLANSILVKVANSTGTANLQPTQLVIGTSTVNSTAFVAGANIFLNTTTLSVGNTTANLLANSILVRVANSISGANLQPTQLVIGANVVLTTGLLSIGNSTVNTVINSTAIVGSLPHLTDTLDATLRTVAGTNYPTFGYMLIDEPNSIGVESVHSVGLQVHYKSRTGQVGGITAGQFINEWTEAPTSASGGVAALRAISLIPDTIDISGLSVVPEGFVTSCYVGADFTGMMAGHIAVAGAFSNATPTQRYSMMLIDEGSSTHSILGSTYDAHLCMSSAGGAGARDMILINNSFGAFPVAAGGVSNILKIRGGTPAFTAGIDISSATFSGNAFSSPNFSVSGTGAIFIGNSTVNTTANSISIAIANSTTSTTINSQRVTTPSINVSGGAIGTTPTPIIRLGAYYDSDSASVSHIDMFAGTYGFGVSPGAMNYIADQHIFYDPDALGSSILTVNSTAAYAPVFVATGFMVPTLIFANASFGSAGQVLKTDGATTVYWDAPGGVATPAGANQEIQFNDSGATGANVEFKFDKATKTIHIGNSTVNAFANSIQITVRDATNTANLTANRLQLGINEISPTGYSSGANVSLNSTRLSVGNTTVNLIANSVMVRVSDAAGAITLGATDIIFPQKSGVDNTPNPYLVAQATDARCNFGQVRWAASVNSARHILAKSRGATAGDYTAVQADDELGEILFAGSDGTDFDACASMRALVDGAVSTNDIPGRLVFATTPDGSPGVTDRWVMDSLGHFKTASGHRIKYPLYSGTVAAAASLSFDVSPATIGNFVGFELHLYEWQPVTDAVQLWVRLGDSGGVDVGAADYAWNIVGIAQADTAVQDLQDASDDSIEITLDTQGNASGEALNAIMWFDGNLADTTPDCRNKVFGMLNSQQGDSAFSISNFGGQRLVHIDLTTIQLLFSSGNIASGYYELFGIAV